MRYRRVVVVTDAATAPGQLRSADRRRRPTAVVPDERPQVAFVFPGGGSQYPGMGARLDDRFDVFHRVRREGIEAMRRLGGVDLEPLLAPDADPQALRRATASLPAVFITSTSLARQWMAWGVEPDVMIGHSLGEYVAAHLAGVLSFDDALSLVITRSGLMERVSGVGAAMLVVPLPEADVASRLPGALSLATVNAADECVVAGPAAAIADFAAALSADGVEVTHIPLAAAAHSSMLDSVLDEFEAAVRRVKLALPQRRYASNLTGGWITPEQATDPRYWVDHLRHTVRFADGLRTAMADRATVVIELGPGQSLASYARRTGLPVAAISTLRHPDDDVADSVHTLGAVGQLWLHGIDVDLGQFMGTGRRRLRLPTYPFQRERCWIEPGTGSVLGGAVANDAAGDAPIERYGDVDDMGWLPSWSSAPPRLDGGAAIDRWIVIGGAEAGDLAVELRRRGRTVVHAPRFRPDDATVAIGADGAELDACGVVIVGDGRQFDAAVDRWLDDSPAAAKWLATVARRGRLVAVTRGALGVDAPARVPADALALGTVLVVPGEYTSITAALVDLDPDAAVDTTAVAHEVELAVGVVALRGADRLVPGLAPAGAVATVDGAGFRPHGTYVVTGGLGGVGAHLAAHLAVRYAANLVILSSEPVPTGADRVRFLRSHAFDDPTCRRIRCATRLEQLGVKVEVIQADLDDPDQIRQALDLAERTVGHIDGAVHAAGRLRDRLLEMATLDDHRFVVEPKAEAALVLADELERRGAELLVLVSSTSTVLAPEGQTSYVAANCVLDALAGRHNGLRVVTVGFGVWSGTGMASEAARRMHLGLPDGHANGHPVLGEVGVDHHGRTVVSGRLTTDHHWVVDEHRTAAGVAVLPGTGHLELMIAGARTAGVADVRLDQVVLLEPLIVPDGGVVTVRVVVEAEANGRRAVRIDSDAGTGSVWVTHSEASLAADHGTTTAVDVPAVAGRCTLDGVDPMAGARAHLRLGGQWLAELTVHYGDGEAFGEIGGAAIDVVGDGWLAHPALVDLATGFGIALDAPRCVRLSPRTGRLRQRAVARSGPLAVHRARRAALGRARAAARRSRDRRPERRGRAAHRRAATAAAHRSRRARAVTRPR